MSKRFHVVVTDLFRDDLAPERSVLEDIATVEWLDAHGEEELVGKVEQADALIVAHNVRITSATLDRLERCQVIARTGVGFDNIDFRAARVRGIPVANVPDYGTEEVADSAIGLVLALARGIHRINLRLLSGQGPWDYTQARPLYRLRGRTLGLIGFGAIGLAVAARARVIGLHVLCHDPFMRSGFDKAAGVERVLDRDELLRRSNVLSLHCGLAPETRHMIGGRELELLPTGAILVNTARGALVDTAAIPAAIASGRLAGAGFDVLEAEPPPADDPLMVAWRNPAHPAHERVIINPHIAFYSEESMVELRKKAALACRHALVGQPILNVVNAG